MNAHAIIPLAVYAAAMAGNYAASKYMRARPWPASLRATIMRNARIWLALAGVQAAYIGLWAGLHAAGYLPLLSMIIPTVWCGICLAADVLMLARCGRALRIYKSDPAAAYIAEVRHAFGPLVSPASMNGPNYSNPHAPGYRHFSSCECGHCPPAS